MNLLVCISALTHRHKPCGIKALEIYYVMIFLPEKNLSHLPQLLVSVASLWYPRKGIFWDSHGRMGYARKLYFCGIISWASKLPFPLVPSKKRSWSFGGAKIGASVQGFHSMLQPLPIQHWDSCSPLAHCVWAPHGLGPHGRMLGSQVWAMSQVPRGIKGVSFSGQIFAGL